MIPTMYRITFYSYKNQDPTKYPIPLNIKKRIVVSREDAELVCSDDSAKMSSFEIIERYIVDKIKTIYDCYLIQELEIDDSGRSILLNEWSCRRLHICSQDGNLPVGCDSKPTLIRGRLGGFYSIVEVVDGNRLTLGIIIHIPHIFDEELSGQCLIGNPYLLHQCSMLLYKPSGEIKREEVSPTRILPGFTGRVKDEDRCKQAVALRTASENICVQE